MTKSLRCPLIKRIPRDLKRNFVKYLGMVLILICTISVGSAFQSALNGATDYLNNIEDDNILEDGFFEISNKLPDNINYFADNDIEVKENFYLTDTSYEKDTKILIFNERTDIDIPSVFEGRLPSGNNEIALDHVFARGKGIKIGDKITLCGTDFTVCGTVALPDYSSLFMNNTDLVMNTAHFCVSVITEEQFNAMNSDSVTYRYSYRYSERDLSDKAKAESAVSIQKELLTAGNDINSFITAEQNQSITFLKMDIGTDGPFMVVFVYMLVALIAFIFAVLTNNKIEQEAVIIGTLLASGYNKKEIIRHYLTPTLIIAAVGSIIGNLLGYTLMIKPFENLYYTTYSIGRIEHKFSLWAFISTTIIPIVLMLLINYLMLRRKLSLKPLAFLQNRLKKNKSKNAGKLPDISFINRWRIRVILKNKGSYIILFVGVFLASFLLMFGIGIKPLMDHYTTVIDASLPYEYMYILKAPSSLPLEKGIDSITTYEMKTWFALGQKDISITLMGLDNNSTFFEGALPATDSYDDSDTITVSSAFAKKLNLNVGDSIVLKDNSRDKEYDFKVGKIYSYEAAMAVFMPQIELNRIIEAGDDYYNCLLSSKAINIDSSLLIKKISRSDYLGASNQMLDSFSTVITFVNIFSVIVYMILMYILTKVVIDRNSLTISYMKVFGYRDNEIRRVYLRTTSIVIILSLIVCLPIEALMFKFTLIFLSSQIEGYLDFYLPYWVYAAIIIIGIISYYAINSLQVKDIRKITLATSLKNRE